LGFLCGKLFLSPELLDLLLPLKGFNFCIFFFVYLLNNLTEDAILR
jgi:hypothetical protein